MSQMQAPTAIGRDPAAALARAQREFERGRMRDGIGFLEQAVALDGRNVSARIMLAIAYVRTRQIELAFQQLERAVDLEPDGFGPQCALGELYLRLAIPDQARWHLNAALARATTSTERRYVQGLLREDRPRERRRAARPNARQPFWLLNRGRAEP